MNVRSSLLAAGLLATATTGFSQLIAPVSAQASGILHIGSPNLVIDGYVPSEGSSFLASSNVRWVGLGTAITVDLGWKYSVKDVLVSVDNNDRYAVDFSTDGLSFSHLFTILPSYGEIPSWRGGMDTMSTDVLSPEYIAAIDFAPVTARYLKIYATGGDYLNAVGEIQAFGSRLPDGSPVPEPSTYGLLAAAGLLALVGMRRRSCAKKSA